MRKRSALAIALVASSALALGVQASTAAQPSDQQISRLFSQTASHGTMKPVKGKRFTLKLFGVNPKVRWTSDRLPRQSSAKPKPALWRSSAWRRRRAALGAP